MNDCEIAFRVLLDEARSFLNRQVPEALNFCTGSIFEELALRQPMAQRLPMFEQIPQCLDLANSSTLPLLRALAGANQFLEWQQSYTLADGFDSHYLANYGWFNLISPDGPYRSPNVRLSFGYWNRGLYYKEHWHEPEEMYVPLAGRALFHSQGTAARECGPGDVVRHHSNQPHAIDMVPGPLLALAIWRGPNLNRKSDLPPARPAG
jgi:hypothetical protein|tara:strand:- start:739 stop:1359 length:621 start_codon:yes stop_codon:yes gene_type:complete